MRPHILQPVSPRIKSSLEIGNMNIGNFYMFFLELAMQDPT